MKSASIRKSYVSFYVDLCKLPWEEKLENATPRRRFTIPLFQFGPLNFNSTSTFNKQ